ncbi:formylmethanofuran dehydrogenase subunit A [Candidatus Bathyarchaeota archaeon]|nr:formylmethanofuran dehydrogenase subunit A [Candidatus Bathyarchaeota archaeon]
MELLIKNGIVYDPLNGIDGERMDIAVRDGRIVEDVSPKAEVVDASGMIVMPGGVDIHSHIAGSKVNTGRLMRPEDHYGDYEQRRPHRRAGVGRSIPSTYTTGYRYAEMGYTTVFEPASPPIKARHTHEELDETPMIDKGCFTLLGNNWLVMDYLRDGMIEECKGFVAWMLEATKGYAVKLVNPGGVEAWGWGRYVIGLDDEVPRFGITPREIIEGLCRVNSMLKLPHPIHVHTNNMARVGNYETTIATMETVSNQAAGSPCNIHVTHVQFTGRKGSSWVNVRSGAEDISSYVNRRSHAELDVGQIIFGDTTTMTADGSFQYLLHILSGNKWANADVEVETGAGVVPYTYRRSNYVNAVQWGIGLELALLIEDPWRVHMTTDHPNGGPFTEYPRVIAWLMSRRARDKTLSKINKTARRRLNLPGIDREYTLGEIATVTRAATARSLGLTSKGHLGVGADADIAIYAVDAQRIDPSREYKLVRRAFRRAAYTIKDGEIVVKDGEIVKTVFGRTFWVKPRVEEELMEKVREDVKEKFEEYYTVRFGNYPIPDSYLKRPHAIKAGG